MRTRVLQLHCLFVGLLLGLSPVGAAEEVKPSSKESKETTWSEADTKLANQYLHLLEKDPGYGKVFELLWGLYEKRGQTEVLDAYLAKAAQAGTGVAPLLDAHVKRRQGDIEAARERYNKVWESNQQDRHALRGLAEIADETHRESKALSYYTRLVELGAPSEEEQVRDRLKQADLMRRLGQSEGAIQTWENMLSKPGLEAQQRRSIMADLIGSGRPEVVIAALEKQVESTDSAESLAALEELVRIHALAGDFAKASSRAVEALNRLHFQSPQAAELFARLVRLHERFDELPALQQQLAVAATPPTEAALFRLAEFAQLTADPLAEEEAVQTLLSLVPGQLQTRLRLIELQIRNDHYDEAFATLAPAWAAQPSPPFALVMLQARIALHREGRESAASILEGFWKTRSPTEAEYQGIVDFASENYLDGLLEDLLTAKAGSAPAPGENEDNHEMLKLARFYHERGREQEADKVLREFVEGAGDFESEKAQRLHRTALHFDEFGQRDEALEMISEALRISPQSLDYLAYKADLLIASRQFKDAMAQLELLRLASPDLEAKTEVDQRLFSLLRGQFGVEKPAPEPTVLGGDRPASLKEFQKEAAAASQPGRAGDEPPPPELVQYYQSIRDAANEHPDVENRYRAAWWAFKLQNFQDCYEQLTKGTAEAGQPVVLLETMLLELAELNERPTLSVPHLTTLAEIDPEHADEYLQRRAELQFELGYEDESVRELIRLTAKPGASLATRHALAKVYQRQGSPGKQAEVWQKAYRAANLFEKRDIIKLLSAALIEAGQPEEALAAEFDLLATETDLLQRRKLLEGQISTARAHGLMDHLEARYDALVNQHPFDSFYAEARAQVLIAANKGSEAFAAMKKAYYLSDEQDGLVVELSRLAEQEGDLDAAVFYQRKLMARAETGPEDDLETWRTLIATMEKDLRFSEARELRERLERKYGQNPDVLRELAEHYMADGYYAAAERVLTALVELRTWDTQSALQLGILQEQRGRLVEAQATFANLLNDTADTIIPPDIAARVLPVIRVSTLPRERQDDGSTALDHFVVALENLPIPDEEWNSEDLVKHWTGEHPEFAVIPDQPAYQRLRIIEEAAALAGKRGQAAEFVAAFDREGRPRVERLWANRYARDRVGLRKVLLEPTEPEQGAEDAVLAGYLWLLCQDADALAAWIDVEEGDETIQATGPTRSFAVQLASLLLYQVGYEDPLADPEVALEAISSHLSVPRLGLAVFAEMLKEDSPGRAYSLGTTLSELVPPSGEFYRQLSQLSAQAGQRENQAHWLDRALEICESRPSSEALYFQLLTERLSLLATDQDRAAMIHEWRTKNSLFGAWQGSSREALLAMAEKDFAAAARHLSEGNAREFARLSSGQVDPEEVRSDQSQIWQQQTQRITFFAERFPLRTMAGTALVEAFASPLERWTGDLASRFLYEQFLMEWAAVSLEAISPPERAATVANIMSRFAEEESPLELARVLSSRGFHTEAAGVFRSELTRNPGNYTPFQGFLEAAAEARDPLPALELLRQIETREVVAPPGLTVDYLAEQRARFLLLNRDWVRLEELSRAGMAETSTRSVGTEHLPYRAALVEGYRQSGQHDALLRLLSGMRHRQEIAPIEVLLGAQLLAGKGEISEALAWLEDGWRQNQEPSLQRRALMEAARLQELKGFPDPEKVLEMAKASLVQQPTPVAAALAGYLAKAGRSEEASSILQGLYRSRTDESSRFAIARQMLQLRRSLGMGWKDLAPEIECLAQNFSGAFLPSQEPDVEVDSGGKTEAALLAKWLMTDPEAATELAKAKDLASIPDSTQWFFDILCGAVTDDLSRATHRLSSDLDESDRLRLWEWLPSFGDEGRGLALELIADSGRPGFAFFPENPRRAMTLFHEIGDRARLLECHEVLMAEATADSFQQYNLAERIPSLVSRQSLPRWLHEIGEKDLAARLFRRYDEAIASYRWNHVTFVNDYLAFLVETGDFAEADRLIEATGRKSLPIDLRTVVRLYEARGKLDETEVRARNLGLGETELALVREWLSALAEGREMVEFRDKW